MRGAPPPPPPGSPPSGAPVYDPTAPPPPPLALHPDKRVRERQPPGAASPPPPLSPRRRELKRETKAAMRLQRSFRGYRDRQQPSHLAHVAQAAILSQRFSEVRAAARVLQRWGAARSARSAFLNQKAAATVLQGGARGMLARNELRERKTAKMVSDEWQCLATMQERIAHAMGRLYTRWPSPSGAHEGGVLMKPIAVDTVVDPTDAYRGGWVAALADVARSLTRRGLVIKTVVCGGSHTVLLASSGDVYVWGRNDNGQLGLGSVHHVQQPEVLQALSYRPEGLDKGQPSNLTRINQVAVGQAHTLALAESGIVYAWGQGRRGQLGLGHTKSLRNPVPIDALTRWRVTAIGAGANHSVCLSQASILYSWGQGGMLGRAAPAPLFERDLESRAAEEVPADESLPRAVLFHYRGDQQRVRQVAVGWRHTLALTHNGEVFGFGANNHGQLGAGHTNAVYTPQNVAGLHGQRRHAHIASIAAGARHSLAVTENGRVFGWGWNDNGQLGLGDAEVRVGPQPIEALAAKHVTRMVAGWRYSIFMTQDRELYVSGHVGWMPMSELQTSKIADYIVTRNDGEREDAARAHLRGRFECHTPMELLPPDMNGMVPVLLSGSASHSLAIAFAAYAPVHTVDGSAGLDGDDDDDDGGGGGDGNNDGPSTSDEVRESRGLPIPASGVVRSLETQREIVAAQRQKSMEPKWQSARVSRGVGRGTFEAAPDVIDFRKELPGKMLTLEERRRAEKQKLVADNQRRAAESVQERRALREGGRVSPEQITGLLMVAPVGSPAPKARRAVVEEPAPKSGPWVHDPDVPVAEKRRMQISVFHRRPQRPERGEIPPPPPTPPPTPPGSPPPAYMPTYAPTSSDDDDDDDDDKELSNLGLTSPDVGPDAPTMPMVTTFERTSPPPTAANKARFQPFSANAQRGPGDTLLDLAAGPDDDDEVPPPPSGAVPPTAALLAAHRRRTSSASSSASAIGIAGVSTGVAPSDTASDCSDTSFDSVPIPLGARATVPADVDRKMQALIIDSNKLLATSPSAAMRRKLDAARKSSAKMWRKGQFDSAVAVLEWEVHSLRKRLMNGETPLSQAEDEALALAHRRVVADFGEGAAPTPLTAREITQRTRVRLASGQSGAPDEREIADALQAHQQLQTLTGLAANVATRSRSPSPEAVASGQPGGLRAAAAAGSSAAKHSDAVASVKKRIMNMRRAQKQHAETVTKRKELAEQGRSSSPEGFASELASIAAGAMQIARERSLSPTGRAASGSVSPPVGLLARARNILVKKQEEQLRPRRDQPGQGAPMRRRGSFDPMDLPSAPRRGSSPPPAPPSRPAPSAPVPTPTPAVVSQAQAIMSRIARVGPPPVTGPFGTVNGRASPTPPKPKRAPPRPTGPPPAQQQSPPPPPPPVSPPPGNYVPSLTDLAAVHVGDDVLDADDFLARMRAAASSPPAIPQHRRHSPTPFGPDLSLGPVAVPGVDDDSVGMRAVRESHEFMRSLQTLRANSPPPLGQPSRSPPSPPRRAPPRRPPPPVVYDDDDDELF